VLGTFAALLILAGSYFFARSTPPQVRPTAPAPDLPLLGVPRTPDPLAGLLTPTGVERAADGRYLAPDLAQPLIIPDNSRAGAISRIRVPEHFTVGGVQVINLQVRHPDMSELAVRLLAPDLTLVPLVQNICPGNRNWLALSLDDRAPKLLGSECLDGLNDFYRPPPEHGLGLFNGIDAHGEWVLSVTDTRPSNVGYLEGWSLRFTPGLTATTTLTPAAPTPILTGTITVAPATAAPTPPAP
jgi:subtilisin-like proprotein convertase family protein